MKTCTSWLTLCVVVASLGLLMAQDKPVKQTGEGTPEQMNALKVGRQYTTAFYKGDLALIHGKFSAGMKEEFSYKKLSDMRRFVADVLGGEQNLISEEVQIHGDNFEYRRRARFNKVEEPFEVLWLLYEDDSIAAFFIRDARAGEADTGS